MTQTEKVKLKVSKQAAALSPSLTLALTAKAKAMQAEGIDVVSFGAGEPDFDTPDFIKDVAIEDLRKGVTKYTPERGLPLLVGAVQKALDRDYGLKYEPNQIVVSVGGKHSLFNLMFVLIDPGDEVIIPSPYWLTYPEQVVAFHGKPVIVECPPSADFKITPEQLRAAITPRTVAFILNSPSNPTGSVYTKEELLALGKVLLDFPHVTLVSDDLYQKLVYAPHAFHSLPAMMPELLPRTVIVNGLSKAYSMTGWRLGWAAGPLEIMTPFANLQSHSTSNVTSFTQRAAATALLSDHSFLGPWVKSFDERRKLIAEGLRAIPGIRCPEPGGAFYVFPDVSGLFGKSLNETRIDGSMTLAKLLLEHARVALIPGKAFGEDRCVRLSYATSEKTIIEGIKRIGEFARSLK